MSGKQMYFFFFQLDLMRAVQHSIIDGRFPEFIEEFFNKMFPDKVYPDWAVEALKKVNIHLKSARIHKLSNSEVSTRDVSNVNEEHIDEGIFITTEHDVASDNFDKRKLKYYKHH